MAKVYMTCGKICSGKSTYADGLRRRFKGVVLSVDEITLALFPEGVGEMHDTYVERAESYLFAKSLELIEVGIDVILDWGFWTKVNRDKAKEFYKVRGIDTEMHYIDVCDETWKQRLAYRNAKVEAGETEAYYVDENLATKFAAIFETPDKDEINIWSKA